MMASLVAHRTADELIEALLEGAKIKEDPRRSSSWAELHSVEISPRWRNSISPLDPETAKIVMESGIPIRMFGLNATR